MMVGLFLNLITPALEDTGASSIKQGLAGARGVRNGRWRWKLLLSRPSGEAKARGMGSSSWMQTPTRSWVLIFVAVRSQRATAPAGAGSLPADFTSPRGTSGTQEHPSRALNPPADPTPHPRAAREKGEVIFTQGTKVLPANVGVFRAAHKLSPEMKQAKVAHRELKNEAIAQPKAQTEGEQTQAAQTPPKLCISSFQHPTSRTCEP